MAFDFKKEYKEFYLPKNKPSIIDVPKANYIAVRGKGNPNEEGGLYQEALGILYSVAYTLKMSYKTDYKIKGFFEYVTDMNQSRLHHEIYLSDPRKTASEKLKTVIRHPIKKMKKRGIK